MQIELKNVSYKKFKNLNFDIINNEITGIISNSIYDLENLNLIIKNNIKQSGNIRYSLRDFKNKIGIISINDIYNINKICDNDTIIHNIFFDFLEIDNEIINKDMTYLSTTEKIKILFLSVLSKNPDTILIDGIFEVLDKNMRNKFLKLILNLKKFYNKTIVICTIDSDIIYEYVDNLIFIINGESYYSKNKYSVFENKDIKNNQFVSIPFVKKIENMVNEKNGINLGNNENINELIKSIYREIR